MSSDNGHANVEEVKLPLLSKDEADHVLEIEEADSRPAAPQKTLDTQSRAIFIFWVVANCICTIFIVFLNRTILTSDHFRGAPTLFVAFHFGCTSLCMYALSSERMAVFERKQIPWQPVMPICIVHGASTIITNASLAMLEVPTYQLMRVLLTPTTVVVNLALYRKTISVRASACLAVVCIGVAGMTLADTRAKAAQSGASSDAHRNTIFGYVAGIAGVFLASLYTIWIGRYHTRFEATSMQLLLVISPISTALLWGLSPFVDRLPIWREVTLREWLLILGAGLCAVGINISQFRIVSGSSAVASTVVGHLKTCMIVAIGWTLAHTNISMGCGIGIVTALGGIFAYSYITMTELKK